MTAAKRKKSFLVVRILFILNILFVILLLGAYASPYISPARIWVFAFFGLAYPILLAVNLFFALLWLVLWRKYFWLPVIVIAFGINHLFSVLQIHFSSPSLAPPGAIKLLSFNVHNLYGNSERKSGKHVLPDVIDFLGRQQPAILCLQELDVATTDSSHVIGRIASTVNDPYVFFKNYFETRAKKRINALAIFSRYPIVRNGYFRLNGRSVFGIFTDQVINGDTIRIYNLHLESFHFGREDYSFYEQLTEKETEQFKFGEGSEKIFAKLKKAFIIRAQQVEVVRRELKNSPYPVIVMGDFNDTPVSYTYREMTRNLKDSFKEAGSGLLGNTFAGNFPSYRIDYILYDRDFKVYGYRKYPIELSDHYPVSVSIDLKP
jgi:endonuclease/exonuclease/phosphatase family metal-dependent hydrolase